MDEFVVSDGVEESLFLTFPHEEPMNSDFWLWEEAIKRLCHGTTKIPYQLGNYLEPPHLPRTWFATTESEAIYRVSEDTNSPAYDIYTRLSDRVATRHGS